MTMLAYRYIKTIYQKKYLFAATRKKFVIHLIFYIENIASFYRKLQSTYQIIRKSNFYISGKKKKWKICGQRRYLSIGDKYYLSYLSS